MDVSIEAVLAGIEAAERYTTIAKQELDRCTQEIEFLGWPIPQYRVEWSTRGHVAGWCMYTKPILTIKFNAFLAKQEGERFRETVAHEFAHAVCFVKYGPRVHHGFEWRTVMQILGYAGDRCHRYATMSAAQMRRRGI